MNSAQSDTERYFEGVGNEFEERAEPIEDDDDYPERRYGS